LAKDALAMRAAVERPVKESGDFPKSEGLVAGHRLAPRIMVEWANQSMTCAESEAPTARI
jgi:hypothetical protein